MADTPAKCECGNDATDTDGLCDWCSWVATQPPHTGHFGMSQWICDTCGGSPYCELA